MKKLLTYLLILALLSACGRSNSTVQEEDLRRADSLALHLAVIPTLGTLPFYYAERIGLADSVGLDLRLHHYTSLMDIDTAVFKGHALLFITDSTRLAFNQTKITAKPAFTIYEPLTLLLKCDAPHKKLTGLFEETLAISRHCSDEAWCMQLIDSARMSIYDVYRPQIHDISLRSQMLQNKLLDAAILPQPYVSVLHRQGCPILAMCSTGSYAELLIAKIDTVPFDTHRNQQMELLQKVYDASATLIAQGALTDTIAVILKEEYGIDQQFTDSLQLPNIPKLRNR